MSRAKETVLYALNEVPENVDDEIEVINTLYHNVRLSMSRQAVTDGNVYSTDDVRDYFTKKRQRVTM